MDHDFTAGFGSFNFDPYRDYSTGESVPPVTLQYEYDCWRLKKFGDPDYKVTRRDARPVKTESSTAQLQNLPAEIRQKILEPLTNVLREDPPPDTYYSLEEFQVPPSIEAKFFVEHIPKASAEKSIAVKAIPLPCPNNPNRHSEYDGPYASFWYCRCPGYDILTTPDNVDTKMVKMVKLTKKLGLLNLPRRYPICFNIKRLRPQFDVIARLATISKGITKDLGAVVWRNSAIAFRRPAEFNTFVRTRPAAIQHVRGISAELGDRDLTKLTEWKCPSGGSGTWIQKTLDPPPATRSLAVMLDYIARNFADKPLEFFRIILFIPCRGKYTKVEGPGETRRITYASPWAENKTSYLEAVDTIIKAWQPYFRALPTKRFYVHFGPHTEWCDDLARVREGWEPDCLRTDLSDPKTKYLQVERQA